MAEFNSKHSGNDFGSFSKLKQNDNSDKADIKDSTSDAMSSADDKSTNISSESDVSDKLKDHGISDEESGLNDGNTSDKSATKSSQDKANGDKGSNTPDDKGIGAKVKSPKEVAKDTLKESFGLDESEKGAKNSKDDDGVKGAMDKANKVRGVVSKIGMVLPVAKGVGMMALAGILLSKLKAFLLMILNFLKGLWSKITGAFMGFVGFIGNLLGLGAVASTAIASSAVLVGVLLPIMIFVSVFTANIVQRDDVNCVPKAYEQSTVSIEQQGQAVADKAREYASEDIHYTYTLTGDTWTLTKDRNSGKGIECGHFCQYVFWECDSDIVTNSKKYGDVNALYSGLKKYTVKTYSDNAGKTGYDESDMQPGDILLFGSASNLEHAAIYIGNNEIAHASSSGQSSTYGGSDGYIGVTVTPITYSTSSHSLKYVVRPYKAKKDGESVSGSGTSNSGAVSSGDAFYKKYKKEIMDGWKKYHLYPSVTIAQAQQETSFGTAGAGRAPTNNLYGTSGSGTYGSPYWKESYGTTARPSNEGSVYHKYPSLSLAILDRNWWLGNMGHYKAVRNAKSAVAQANALSDSGWAAGGYDNSGILALQEPFLKYDKNLPESDYDPSKESSLVDSDVSSDNDTISDMKSSDGCGGTKDENLIDKIVGMLTGEVNGSNGEYLSFDKQHLAQIGSQDPAACGVWATAYGWMVTNNKGYSKSYVRSHFGIGGAATWKNMTQHSYGSVEARNKAIYKEIATNKRPVVVTMHGYGSYSWGHNHFVTVIGWKKGMTESNIKWDDFIILNPSDGQMEFMNHITAYAREPGTSSYGILMYTFNK